MVRKMTKDDIEGVYEIELLCFSVPWSKESLLDELNNKNASYYVFEDDKRIWGFAGMHQIVDEAHITNVAVHPQKRRQGIGKALLNMLIDEAKKKNLAGITLEVRCKNQAAIRLYKGFGFEEAGIRKNYYTHPTDDALIMWLWLRQS